MEDEMVLTANAGVNRDTTVVVPTGGGERFHRPGVLFETACRVDVGAPPRETTAVEALEEGYTPCRLPDCYGDRE